MTTRRALLTLAGMAVLPTARAGEPDAALRAAIASGRRSAKFVARDGARHPFEELSFFGLRPDATVIEIWPGGGYWTEILAPYLRERGRYIVLLPSAGQDEGRAEPLEQAGRTLVAKLAGGPAVYDRVVFARSSDATRDIAPAGSADFVLTFRNLHNWMADGTAELMLAAFARALKPGGILGFEEHRGRPDRPQDPKAASGYVRQDYAVALAEHAGFALDGSSEVNANPKDTTDWPAGVWTLPPTLRLGAKDKAKYLAVGEADNFVLRFRKTG